MVENKKRADEFISKTIYFETGGKKDGAYTNDKRDSGGETKWGISKTAHPDLNIKTLTYKDAKAIYEKEYFNKLYDSIRNEKLAFKVFDMGVLMGPYTAVRLLQKAIVKYRATIKVDGRFGPMTSAAINMTEDDVLYEAYLAELRARVYWITLIKPWNKAFLKGWTNRINYNYGEADGK